MMNNDEMILQLLTQINSRLDGIDTRLDGMDARFDGIDTRLDGMDARLDKLETSVGQMGTDISAINLTIETELRPSIQLLAEGQKTILDKLTPREEIEDQADRLDAAEALLRIHSREIARLKKAQ
jgi:chromosome segregation ATPase